MLYWLIVENRTEMLKIKKIILAAALTVLLGIFTATPAFGESHFRDSSSGGSNLTASLACQKYVDTKNDPEGVKVKDCETNTPKECLKIDRGTKEQEKSPLAKEGEKKF